VGTEGREVGTEGRGTRERKRERGEREEKEGERKRARVSERELRLIASMPCPIFDDDPTPPAQLQRLRFCLHTLYRLIVMGHKGH
jgi:hypothetical protein